MFNVTKYPHGTFCWSDCASTEPEKTKKFYADVMGWETHDLPLMEGMYYTFFRANGDDVAASGGMMPDMLEQGVPSHWSNYVSVNDVDAVVKKAIELGAKVVTEAYDVFDSGRMAVVEDPTGVTIAFWQPNNYIGAKLVNTPGSMTWNELSTRDPEKAKTFYTELLGWEFQEMIPSNYWMIHNKGRMNGGMAKMDEKSKDMPSMWSVYFSVKDIKETAEKVKSSGGKLIVDVSKAQGIGEFVLASDPTGAICYFIQLNEPQPWTE